MSAFTPQYPAARPPAPGLLPVHALLRRQRFTEALEILRERVAQDPDELEARERARRAQAHRMGAVHQRALELVQQGQPRVALGMLEELLLTAPNPVTQLWAAGLASDCGHLSLGLSLIDRLLEREPGNVPGLRLGCLLAVGAGLTDRLDRYAQVLLRLDPSDETLLLTHLALPAIQESRHSIAASRAAYAQGLAKLERRELSIEDPGSLVGVQSFFLAYHGECDRELQERTAALYARALPRLTYTAPHCRRPGRRPGRIRLGLISRYFYRHSIGKTSRGLLERLDRSRFEVFMLHLVPAPKDEWTAQMRAVADHHLEVSGDLKDLSASHERIGALELDVLFYQDIGMEPASYFLAFARLAPVQCVSFGHPNTTGIANVDYFISNDRYETPGAQAHYSERLVQLNGLPTLAYYHRPPLPAMPPSRMHFGLPEAAHVYVCPQTLFKIHPQFDALLLAIIERDPDALVVMIQADIPEWTQQLRERLGRSLGPHAARVHFLRSQPGEDFLQLLRVSDVMLDTVHFNGMNSSLEALAMGLPIVTLPTGLQRGRHTAAMYACMGLSDCVARDPGEYVDIAVRLACDPAFRERQSQLILQRNDVLYENADVVRQFEDFLERAHGARGQPPRPGAGPGVAIRP